MNVWIDEWMDRLLDEEIEVTKWENFLSDE